MILTPGIGLSFIEPIDEIPSSKQETGFGAKTLEKSKPEEPYKFRVKAVGGPVPTHGLWVSSEVKSGDIISTIRKNATLRGQRETEGLVLDGVWYLVVDFQDVLGIWRNDETTIASASVDADRNAVGSV